MKIQLDTTLKTIKVEETVNLGEFIEALERLLPDGVWKEFKLETQTVINWNSNPIVIEPFVPYRPYNPYTLPWWQQPVIYSHAGAHSDSQMLGTSQSYNLNSGVYNIEL